MADQRTANPTVGDQPKPSEFGALVDWLAALGQSVVTRCRPSLFKFCAVVGRLATPFIAYLLLDYNAGMRAASGGYGMLDLQFAWTASNLERMMVLWEKQGIRNASLGGIQAFIFAVWYGVLGFGFLGLSLKRLQKSSPKFGTKERRFFILGHGLIPVLFLAVTCDFIETGFFVAAMNWLPAMREILVPSASCCALLKWVFLAWIFAYLNYHRLERFRKFLRKFNFRDQYKASFSTSFVVFGLFIGMLSFWSLSVSSSGISFAFLLFFLLAFVLPLGWVGQPIWMIQQKREKLTPQFVEPKLLDMVPIKAGKFLMGSPVGEKGRYDQDERQHSVKVSVFSISRYVVTREEYRSVMENEPESWSDDPTTDARFPANHINWYEAVRFCNALSRREGLEECYPHSGDEEEPEVSWNEKANGYRLPTEAEWEYACRAKTTTRFSFGDDEAKLPEYANTGNGVEAVGQRKPNDWGLYDMHGNVREWCWDWYRPDYENDRKKNPIGPANGDWRVLRGGSFDNVPWILRSACRNYDVPRNSDSRFGFRVVRSSRRQP